VLFSFSRYVAAVCVLSAFIIAFIWLNDVIETKFSFLRMEQYFGSLSYLNRKLFVSQ
jgi:hypothetical protein